MAALHVLRVFVNDEGEWGNPLGVFLDGADVPAPRRQAAATELGFSETVFVDDRKAGRVQIFTPAVEIPFAGHPLVGAAWLLRREGDAVEALLARPGQVEVRFEDGAVFISADPRWSPDFEFQQLSDPSEVLRLAGPPGRGDVYAWAWVDEDAGTIRARSFAPGYGIAEDEATGSAALALSARLGRPITVHQGRGSVLTARPLEGGRAEVGGAVVLDEVRDYAV